MSYTLYEALEAVSMAKHDKQAELQKAVAEARRHEIGLAKARERIEKLSRGK